MKRLLFFITLLLESIMVHAYDAIVDGIYYNLDRMTKTAEVTKFVTEREELYDYKKYKGDVSIPSAFFYNNQNYKVTSIGEQAFSGCNELISIAIPNSVTSIGSGAFSGCYLLNSISLPSNIRTIPSSAFSGCSSLSTTEIPSSVTSIEQYAFSGCYNKIIVNNSTPASISDNTFPNRKNQVLYVPIGSKSIYLSAEHWKDFKEIKEMTAQRGAIVWTENWDNAEEGTVVENVVNANAAYLGDGNYIKLYSKVTDSANKELFIPNSNIGEAFSAEVNIGSECHSFTLTYYANRAISVLSTTPDAVISSPTVSNNIYTHEITVAQDVDKINLTFMSPTTLNARLDDIVLIANNCKDLKRVPFMGFSDTMIYSTTNGSFVAPTLSYDGDGTIVYESSNSAVATVDATTGIVNILSEGTTTITAKASETDRCLFTERSYTVIVDNNLGLIIAGNEAPGTIDIGFKGEGEFLGFQFDVYIPDDVKIDATLSGDDVNHSYSVGKSFEPYIAVPSIGDYETNYPYEITTQKKNGFYSCSMEMEEGQWLAFGSRNSVVWLDLLCPESTQPFTAKICNIHFLTKDYKKIRYNDCTINVNVLKNKPYALIEYKCSLSEGYPNYPPYGVYYGYDVTLFNDNLYKQRKYNDAHESGFHNEYLYYERCYAVSNTTDLGKWNSEYVSRFKIDDNFSVFPQSTSKWFYNTGRYYRELRNDYYSYYHDKYDMYFDKEDIDYNCKKLNTIEVTDMSSMYEGAVVYALDLRHFATSNVVDMSRMFARCDSLKTLNIKNFDTRNVVNMKEMFLGCHELESLDLHNFYINENANTSQMCGDCFNLKELTISSTMDRLADDAFTGVGDWEQPCIIHAPEGFKFDTYYTSNIFYWKGGYFKNMDITIEDISVGDTITYQDLKYVVTIHDALDGSEVRLIKNPSSLREVAIPETVTDESGLLTFTVTAIEDKAFFNNIGITSLYIPATVKSIGKAVTSCATKLQKIVVDEKNPYYDSRDNCNAIIEKSTMTLLAGCNNTVIPEGVTAIGAEAMRGMYDLKEARLPSSLKTIGSMAFYYCTSLTGDLVIPEGVTSTGTYAFHHCIGLTSIAIPSTMQSLGTYSFRECKNVRVVRCAIATPPSIASTMFGNYADCVLMVPQGSVDAYKAADVWKTFKSIAAFGGGNTLSANALALNLGGSGELTLSLSNNIGVDGVQFDVTLPEGLSFATDEDGEPMAETTARVKRMTVSCVSLGGNSYRFVLFSNNRSIIEPGEGAILKLTVQCPETATPGDYKAIFSEIYLSCAYEENSFSVPAEGFETPVTVSDASTIVGDANGDFEINIADVMFIVDHILNRYNSRFIFANADVDGDGRVDVADAMNVVNIILYKPTTNMPANVIETCSDLLRMDGTATGCTLHTTAFSPTLTAMEMTVELPEGCRLAGANPAGKAARTHQAMAHPLGGNQYKVVVFSMDRATVDAGEAFLDLSLEGMGGWVAVKDIQCTDTALETLVSSDLHAVVTGIGGIFTGEDAGSSPVYNVSGQRMAKPRKGVNISKGRKVVIR